MLRNLRSREGWTVLILVTVAVLLGGMVTAQVRTVATETLQTNNLIVFTDTFDGSGSYATYQPLGGATGKAFMASSCHGSPRAPVLGR